MLNRRPLTLLSALFFTSGASSLIFEVLWQRQLQLSFGASAPAITAILTAFFLGIAIGSWVGGWFLTRWLRTRSALSAYAVAEGWIGLWSLAVPPLLAVATNTGMTFAAQDTTSWFTFMVPRFIASVLVVLPATIGMGATIPIMAQLVDQRVAHIGRSTAIAYGANTLGAVLGCLASSFLLLPRLGVTGSLRVALGLNLLVVAVTLIASRSAKSPKTVAEKVAPPSSAKWWVLCYFFMSLVAIGYEVVGFRILAIISSNSLVTYTVGLSIYLAGFALGGLLLYQRLQKRLSGAEILALSNLGVALSTLAVIVTVQSYANWVHRVSADKVRLVESAAFWTTISEVGNGLFVMALPALFMGLAFPAICQVISRGREQLGRDTGGLYMVGNLGAALGAAAAGLVLVPLFGMRGLAFVFAGISVALALIILVMAKLLRRRYKLIAVALVAAIAAPLFLFPAPLVSRGTLKREGTAWAYQGANGSTGTKIIRYAVGPSATVSIEESPGGRRRIYIDDQPVASTFPGAAVDSKMLAHIPLMLHPDPKRALTVGFGSGGTSYSMTTYGIKTDVAEIEPEVIRSAHLFEMQNYKVVSSPLLNVVQDDARNYLLRTEVRYDVISTDVTNLQYKQNSSLYTREFFQLMKDRLTPTGIACAWIPLRAISDFELATLLRTFQDVYPRSSLWYMDHVRTGWAILIGTPTRLRFVYEKMQARFARPAVKADLAAIDIFDPLQLIHFLYLDPKGFRRFAGDGPLHTDDMPVLETSSHVSFYQAHTRQLWERLTAMWKIKPRSLKQYLRGLPNDRLDEHRQFTILGRHYGLYSQHEALPHKMRTKRYHPKMIELLQNITRLSPKAKHPRGHLNSYNVRPVKK